MENQYLINTVLDKIRESASSEQQLVLSIEETKELAKRIGDLRLIPVLTMEQVAKLPGKPLFPKKD